MTNGPIDRYLAGLIEHFQEVAGRPLRPGLSIVGFADRTSNAAVLYDLEHHALVACSPALAARLAPLEGTPADQAVRALTEHGGRRSDSGLNHVWADDAPPSVPSPHDTVRWLDTSDPADQALIESLAAACPEEDVDEADLDLDDPDPRAVVTLADDGTVTAYVSGRPFWAWADNDDIGVLVHPDHRGRGLGRALVAEFVRRHASSRAQLYRHDVQNLGSTAVARDVGFTFVHEVHAIEFPD